MHARIVHNGCGAVHVELLRHGRIKLTRFQCAVAETIEDRAKTVGAKEFMQPVEILDIQGDNAVADKPPGFSRPNADDLAWIALLEVMQRIETGHTSAAGDEQR